MRRKISIGFISLALLLLFSGVISVYELRRLSNQAMELIELNSRNASLAQNMLKGLQKQNSVVLSVIFNDDLSNWDEYNLGRKMFDEAFSEVSRADVEKSDIALVETAKQNYRTVISDYMDGNSGNLNKEQFLETYLNAYYKLEQTLKSYIVSPESLLPTRTTSLEADIYKTITPSILTLAIAIIIVLMFYFFVDSYYVRPLTKIHKALKNNLSHNTPFAPNFESNNDELNGLREMISELTEKKKR